MTTTPTAIRVLKEHDFAEPELARLSYTERTRPVAARLRSRLNIARALLMARVQRGWTQKELAARVGTRQSRISELETVNGNPRFDTVDRTAQALGLEIVLLPRAASAVIRGPFERDLATSRSTLLSGSSRASFRPVEVADLEKMLSADMEEMLRQVLRRRWDSPQEGDATGARPVRRVAGATA